MRTRGGYLSVLFGRLGRCFSAVPAAFLPETERLVWGEINNKQMILGFSLNQRLFKKKKTILHNMFSGQLRLFIRQEKSIIHHRTS